MFYIPNNPLILPKINNSPSTPPGTRGLFAKEDGWYEIDESGLSKKFATGLDTQENTDILNRLRYYGSADIKPSDKNLFTFTIDNSTMTAGVQKRNSSISGDIVIPYECIVDGKTYLITHINNEAFYDCYNINSVYLPNTITYIGATSFGYCTELSNILIPSSVTNIGEYAFWGCEKLTAIIIPNGITTIKSGVFDCCNGITDITIPHSVTNIENCAFRSCDSLRNVYYEGSHSEWNEIVLGYDNTPLRDAVIHYEWTPSTIGHVNDKISSMVNKLKYYGDINITPSDEDLFNFTTDDYTMTAGIEVQHTAISGDIVIPYECVVDGKIYLVTHINDEAFYNCKKLTNITIPNSITNIGESAFQGCIGLTNILIPDEVTNIEDLAFANCNNLSGIKFSNKLTTINDLVFYNCKSLVDIVIPSNITTIQEGAFESCKSLVSLTIPNSVTSIGKSAFNGCTIMTDVYYTGSSSQWNSISIGLNNNNLTSADIHYEWIPTVKGYVDENISKCVTKEDGKGLSTIESIEFSSGDNGYTIIKVNSQDNSIREFEFYDKNQTDKMYQTKIDTTALSRAIEEHNKHIDSHTDMREVLSILSNKINVLDIDNATLEQILEISEYIKSNKDVIESYTANKINYSDIVTNPSNMMGEDYTSVLSAFYGKQLDDNKIDKNKIITSIAGTSYGDIDGVLSSQCGKELDDQKLDKSSVVSDPYYSWDDNAVLSASFGRYLNENKIGIDRITHDPSEVTDKNGVTDGSYVLSAQFGMDVAKKKADQVALNEALNQIENLNLEISNVKQSIPTRMQQLINDGYYVKDIRYTHTDNNFTDEYQSRVDNLDNTIYDLQDAYPEADKIYKMNIDNNIDFNLPTPTDNKFHQILIFATISKNPAITYGTQNYFNEDIPTIHDGKCDIIFEYDGSEWTAGVIYKGMVKVNENI